VLSIDLAETNSNPSAQSQPAWWVSAPSLKLAGGERVVGFDLKLIGYFIQSVADIATGWSIAIVNDSSDEADFSGKTEHLAAAVGADYFRRFVAVQKPAPDYRPPSVGLEVVVTSDFKHQRHIEVPSSQLVLSKEGR
jgi:hypothetical protein